jgi:hypothetical protein
MMGFEAKILADSLRHESNWFEDHLERSLFVANMNDDSILMFGMDPRWIGVIGLMHVNAANEIEIDWLE